MAKNEDKQPAAEAAANEAPEAVVEETPVSEGTTIPADRHGPPAKPGVLTGDEQNALTAEQRKRERDRASRAGQNGTR